MGRIEIEISPREGYVVLEDVTVKQTTVATFGEIRHPQPPLAKVVAVSKPKDDIIPFDDRIVEGAVVLKPVAAKQEFVSGDGRVFYNCHHSDIRVFFKKKEV